MSDKRLKRRGKLPEHNIRCRSRARPGIRETVITGAGSASDTGWFAALMLCQSP